MNKAVQELWEIVVAGQWEAIDQRKCTNCGEWKKLTPPWQLFRDSADRLRLRSDDDSEFSWRKQSVRTTQDGHILVVVIPLGQCRTCMSERVRLVKLDMAEKMGGIDIYNEHRREVDRERAARPGEMARRRTYHREWWRRTKGQNHHVWKKYTGTSVDATPFREWANNFLDHTSYDLITVTHSKIPFHVPRYSISSFAEAGEVSPNTIGAALSGKQKTIYIETVEKILMFCGEQYQLDRLYPA